jgi:hypothetical protein
MGRPRSERRWRSSSRSASRRCRRARRGGGAAGCRAEAALAARQGHTARSCPSGRRAGLGSATRRHEAGSEGEVEHAGLRDDGVDRHARVHSRRAARQGPPTGRPERKLSTGRVADSADVGKVERRVQLGERVDPGRYVEERVRPPAARAYPAVLEVPGGDPVGGEVDADALQQRPVVLGAPVSAVDDDAGRKRPGAGGQEELPELARVGAVRVRRPSHAPGRIRTCGLALRRRALYPLSYGRGRGSVTADFALSFRAPAS